ncbi:hypothetical protein C2S53_008550 [Perilla frutescens var. hirtella]|uniref:Proline-rich protein PRCC n=1 Tax=Perilla frutescens var. hirtella TaxID=608512 RepID=A0AAD4JPP6_PERFH|nr:hypothetical protein C2S53_008550 [Perilla frutescens var. hirtella]
MDLLANYASSDEEEHEERPPPPSQRIPPAKPAKLESESAEEKDENFLTQSAPKRGGIFGSLPRPKSSLFNSLPPPKSQSFSNPEPHRREDEEIAGNPKPKTSLFSSLPRPKLSASASSSAKKVVLFKPPMITNPESISTSSATSFLSSIPAPKHSSTLGVMTSASGMGRRSMLETSVPASNVSTGSDADANPNVGYSNNQSSDANHAYPSWGSEGETPAYYSDNGTGSDGGVNPDSRNYGGFDHSTSLGGESYAYATYGGASTEVSTASTAGIDAGVNPDAGSYEAVDYSYVQGQNVNYSNYGGGYDDNLQYENNWGNSTAVPEASGVVDNMLPVIGKRGRKDVPPEIVEVNQDELMKNRPREDQVKMTGIAFGPAYQPASTKGKPTKLHKRKHQIGSLYFDMRQKETELAERRSRGFLTKAQTQGKYGW